MMRWTVSLGAIGGTVVRVHLTFLLLLGVLAALSWPSGGATAALDSVVFVTLVFGCVLLHEFGHAGAARLYGIRTPDITILPIGGLARLERMPDKPGQELVVALAGPAVNIAIAAVLGLYVIATTEIADRAALEAVAMSMPGRLIGANIFLVVFNMLPAFPLDGGRVLRALLAFRLSRERATKIAARVGQGFAVLFAILGVFVSPMLLLISVFMFLAADAEARFEATQARAAEHKLGDAMVWRAATVAADAPASTALDLMVSSGRQKLAVLDVEGRPVGLLTLERLLAAAKEGRLAAPSADASLRELPSLDVAAPLAQALTLAANAPRQTVFGVDAEGRFRGYVDPETARHSMDAARARRLGSPRIGRVPSVDRRSTTATG